MNQSELGKTEEEIQHPSSAGLSPSETAPSEAIALDITAVETAVDDQNTDAETPVMASDTASDSDADNASAEAVSSTDDTPPDTPEAKERPQKAAETDNGLRRGMLVPGVITRTSPTAVYVDLGEGREGIVPARELEVMNRKTLDDLKEGLEVTVYIINPRNPRGKSVVSINHALEETDWQEAEQYRESKAVYDGKIGGYNKGGLIVRFGRLRGFVPQSQIAETRLREMTGETPEERYGKLINQDVSVKVMEVDRSRNRLILSERAAMREVRQRRKESLITELKPGEVREGTVVSLENFGAFVDVGGAEGLIHLTEITWRHITHPRQVLQVGQTVQVKIITVDPSHNRIGLSIKQLQADPWDEIAGAYASGALVRGVVTKLTKFGAFARIDDDQSIEGLIHISELGEERVEHPREVVKKGDILTLRVVKVDVANRRLGLSLKKVHSAEYLDQDMERAFRIAALPMPEPLLLHDEDDHVPAAGISEEDTTEHDHDDDPVLNGEAPADAMAEAVSVETNAPAEEVAAPAEPTAEAVAVEANVSAEDTAAPDAE